MSELYRFQNAWSDDKNSFHLFISLTHNWMSHVKDDRKEFMGGMDMQHARKLLRRHMKF